MSELEPNSPEQYLKDTLYGLQAYREMAGVDAEPALIQDKLCEDCTVLVDTKTNDRIVLTPLPVDEAEFDGAAVWMSNPLGVEIRQGQWQASPKDVIFWIGKSLSASYFNPDSGRLLPFPNQQLAERIEYPTILPQPMSEYDPREIPEDVEFLHIPKSDTYTLASGIFDYELEKNRKLFATRYGVDTISSENPRAFDITLTELLPGDEQSGPIQSNLNRRGEFDREFLLLLDLGEQIELSVLPWGGGGELKVRGNEFKIRVFREGMIIDIATKGGEVKHCVPTKVTQAYIDRLLHSVAIGDQ